MRTILITLLVFIIAHTPAKAQNDNLVPVPKVSESFPVGKKITYYSLKDIEGNKITAEDLRGKVVVLNFWFIACPPCRREMPGLNELAFEFARKTDVVFIAIALDKKWSLKDFIKTHPLAYHIIDEGQVFSDRYRIHTYPTNVVLDKKGIVRFSDEGFSNTTQYWLRKYINDCEKE
ncbi:MAG: TlpA family protein disulfide reductase [Mucilaginibacter sp.]